MRAQLADLSLLVKKTGHSNHDGLERFQLFSSNVSSFSKNHGATVINPGTKLLTAGRGKEIAKFVIFVVNEGTSVKIVGQG